MPNRILKESICTSDTIDNLTNFEEIFFYRLIVNADDFGRFDARPKILRARLFPLKSDVRDDQVIDSLRKLSLAGIAKVYVYDNRPYLQLTTWSEHQTIRNKKSKYPSLEEGNEISFLQYKDKKINCKEFENICMQLKSNEIKCFRNPIQSNPNPIQSESNPESNPESVIGEKIQSSGEGEEEVETPPPEIPAEKYPIGEFDNRCVDMLISSCLKLYPNSKIPESDSEKLKWAVEVERMRRLDGRSESEIMDALTYAITDDFWKTNIRSTKKLRDKFETLFIQSQQKRQSSKNPSSNNKFNNFTGRQYDFQELEKKLIN